METIFENKYTVTKELYNEIYIYWFFIRPFKTPSSIAVCCFIALLFIIGILSILFPHIFDKSFRMFILPAIIWTIIILIKYRSIESIYKRNLELNHGKLGEFILFVTENEILDISEETKLITNFSHIKEISKTKKYYFIYIQTPKKLIPFKKDSFIKGTPEEFENFIRSKGFKWGLTR